jgi:hypothetical protein
MKSNALLVLAVCLFAAFAAAWTKEGKYYPIAAQHSGTRSLLALEDTLRPCRIPTNALS